MEKKEYSQYSKLLDEAIKLLKVIKDTNAQLLDIADEMLKLQELNRITIYDSDLNINATITSNDIDKGIAELFPELLEAPENDENQI